MKALKEIISCVGVITDSASLSLKQEICFPLFIIWLGGFDLKELMILLLVLGVRNLLLRVAYENVLISTFDLSYGSSFVLFFFLAYTLQNTVFLIKFSFFMKVSDTPDGELFFLLVFVIG